MNEIIKIYWIISLNAEDTNKIFLKSEFDLKIYYLKYDFKNTAPTDGNFNYRLYVRLTVLVRRRVLLH